MFLLTDHINTILIYKMIFVGDPNNSEIQTEILKLLNVKMAMNFQKHVLLVKSYF